MNHKRLIFIIIVLLVVALGITLIWWWVMPRQVSSPPVNNPTPTSSINEPIGLELISTTTAPLPPVQLGVVVMARVWAERFASWSNEDNFSNLEVVSRQATAQVKNFLKTYQQTLMTQYPVGNGYHGVTGRALSPQLVEFNDSAGTALVNVNLQLEEYSAVAQPVISTKVLELKLVKQGEQWLVNFLKWQ